MCLKTVGMATKSPVRLLLQTLEKLLYWKKLLMKVA